MSLAPHAVAPPPAAALPLLTEAVAPGAADTADDAGTGTGRWTVLCVDDEPNIGAALRRALRAPHLQVITATSGAQALEMMDARLVDVVISDMRMPEMDGTEFLSRVRERWPTAVRVLLTGHADMASAVAAINRGGIFRYLFKPWDAQELLATVEQATVMLSLQRERARLEALTQEQNEALRTLNAELEQRVAARTQDLATANRRLKDHYLQSIKVFSGLLELRGNLGGHGRRVAETARRVAHAMALDEESALQVFVAGLVHDVGWIGLPDAMLSRPVGRYSAEELAQYRQHTVRGEQALLALEDLHPVMPMVRGHHERFDGQGFPDRLAGAAIPLGARILAVAEAFDDLQQGHLATPVTAAEARVLMRAGRGTQFDPEVLDVFLHITEPQPVREPTPPLVLDSQALQPGMVLAADLVSARGVLMLTTGHRLTASLIRRIQEFERLEGSHLALSVQPNGPA